MLTAAHSTSIDRRSSIRLEVPVSAHRLSLIARRTRGQLARVGVAVAFLPTAAAVSTAQQIVVGKNVQVSAARPKASHSEVIMAADPKHAERLIAGVHIAYPDTTMPTTSIAYV